MFKSFTTEVVVLLKNGAIGVIPTDTVYGVVTPLFQESSVARIYTLKGRDQNKPVGTILISDPLQISRVTDQDSLTKAQQYWPGPVSVVLPVSHELSYSHKGLNSLAFRIPNDQALQNLVAKTGPLATSSANPAGQQPANTIEEAQSYFGNEVDFYVDGGDLSYSKASKIVRFDEQGNTEVIRGETK